MAKSRSNNGGNRPTANVSPLAAAIGELTATVRQLSATMSPVASVFGKSAPNQTASPTNNFSPPLPTAFPQVDFSPTLARPGVEVLTPDGEKPKAKPKPPEPPPPADWTETATKVNDASRKVLGGFQSIASLGGSPAGAISAIGGQIGRLTANMPPQVAAVGQLVSTFAQLPTLFRSAVASVQSYVSAFSPMASSRFQRAGADLMASVGENLLPVLNAATDVIRWLGDSLAGLTPVIRPVIQWVMNAFRPFGQLIGDVFREVITVGVLVAEAFSPLVQLFAEIASGPLQLVIAGLRGMLDVIRYITRGVAGLMGLAVPTFDGASQGKSAQQASFTNSDDMWRKMVENTVNQGRAAPEMKVPNLLEAIKQKLSELPQDFARALSAEIARNGEFVNQAVGGSVQKFAEGKGLGPVAEHLGNLFRAQTLKRS